MGHSGAQGLSRLRIRFEILGQTAIQLLIDIDWLQQLNRMHGQFKGEINNRRVSICDLACDDVQPLFVCSVSWLFAWYQLIRASGIASIVLL